MRSSINGQYRAVKMTDFWDVAWQMFTNISEVRTASIIRMNRTSEPSVHFCQTTRCNMSLHVRCRENLKSRQCKFVFIMILHIPYVSVDQTSVSNNVFNQNLNFITFKKYCIHCTHYVLCEPHGGIQADEYFERQIK
jgi:hypothetical protein